MCRIDSKRVLSLAVYNALKELNWKEPAQLLICGSCGTKIAQNRCSESLFVGFRKKFEKFFTNVLTVPCHAGYNRRGVEQFAHAVEALKWKPVPPVRATKGGMSRTKKRILQRHELNAPHSGNVRTSDRGS